jgi:hypothetical protein
LLDAQTAAVMPRSKDRQISNASLIYELARLTTSSEG